jgi:hypothetical protein
MLSSLGNQEVQVYTGGTPATSNSSGLAGYINQVATTGTYPGYATADLGAGGPAFYHSATVQVSGASADRLFSYYAGISGTDQSFRFGDQYGGVSDPLYFYPFAVPTTNAIYNVYDGSGFIAAPGYMYEQAMNFDRENMVNLHWAIPHKHSPYRDDIQVLWYEGGIDDEIFSSQNDFDYSPAEAAAVGTPYPLTYMDTYVYSGALMQTPNAGDVKTQLFPSNPSTGAGLPLGPNDRDGNYNGFSIEKLQYQKNFNDSSYLRLIGYGEYSAWLINGPNSALIPFGATPPNQEYIGHTFGFNAIYSNQLSPNNLLTVEGSYQTQQLQTYNAQTYAIDPSIGSVQSTGLGQIITSYGTPNGQCYNYTTGQPWSCFSAGSQGGCISTSPCYAPSGAANIDLTPGYAPAGSPAAIAGARWMVTENGESAQLNNVTPYFSSLAATDLWQPSDRIVVNAGLRLDQFVYRTDNLENGYPARAFWFDAYNNEYCGAQGLPPVSSWNGSAFAGCPAGYLPMTQPGVGLTNSAGTTYTSDVLQPRVSFTYTLNPDTVIRGSLGKYARAEGSMNFQYNTVQQNLPMFIAQFYQYGYNNPDHTIEPDTANDFDLSLERHVRGTKLAFKLTPFFRSTQNQLQSQIINAEEGMYAGLNVGRQQSYGAELAVQYGNFSQDGLSAALTYTHTQSEIRFSPVNGVSVLDPFNEQIELYNSYTSGCAGVTKRSPNWQACGSGRYAGNAQASLPYQPSSAAYPSTIPNPYYNDPIQPLMNTNAEYAPYSLVPGPFSGANGYEVPDVASLILNYRHRKLAVTPSLHYIDGSNYGSPLVWPGYVPQSCTAPPANTPQTPGATCNGTLPNGQSIGVIFLPDPYTGKFDNLGAFMQPSEVSLNLQMTYDISPKLTLTVQAVNIVNYCHQRGYAWDNAETCQYSDLPSQVLAPAGNFVTDPPVQLKYPYGTYFNCSGAGYSAVTQPFSFFVTLRVRM